MNAPHLDSGWAQAWVAGIPLVGGFIVGIFRMIRNNGRKEAAIAAKDAEICRKLAEHDAAISNIAQGQRDLRSALDHQTETLTNRLDRIVEAVLSSRAA